mgnify:CR=1 FL=1
MRRSSQVGWRAGVQMVNPVCPCVYCEVDREKHRAQFIVQWPDGSYYHPDKHRFSTEYAGAAMVYGARHPFGPHFPRIQI